MAENTTLIETRKIDRLVTANPFLDGPAEFLVKTVVLELQKVDVWKHVFGDFIDPYKRMDYSQRNLPALRVYNNTHRKQFDSWFIEGDLVMDVIWPADIRRIETQQLPDTIASALTQQLRRPGFFSAVENSIGTGDKERMGFKLQGVPGLNELGKTVTVDKTLGFLLGGEEAVVPLTQITVNFRIDLRQWDEYLTENCRTKDDPFEQTLGELRRVVTTIQGLRDDGTVSTEIESKQDI